MTPLLGGNSGVTIRASGIMVPGIPLMEVEPTCSHLILDLSFWRLGSRMDVENCQAKGQRETSNVPKNKPCDEALGAAQGSHGQTDWPVTANNIISFDDRQLITA